MSTLEKNLLLVLLLFTATFMTSSTAAADISATRTLSSGTIAPGEEFTVNITTADYGTLGQVVETLPAGFDFVSTTGLSLPADVDVQNNNVTFYLFGQKYFSYNVTASDNASTYNFSGILNRKEETPVTIGGDTRVSVAEVSIPASEPVEDEGEGSSSSSSSSSGGGGGGGSPESASNVEVKELSQQFITNGNHVKFIFSQNVTCITSVEFDPEKTLGKTITIVEMLKGKSTLVPELPPGNVYKSMNLWVGNQGTASPENIKNAITEFRVEKVWIALNSVDRVSIRMWRFDGEKWEELPTVEVAEDGTYVYFKAETSGFSPFAISAIEEAVGEAGREDERLLSSSTEEEEEESAGTKVISGMVPKGNASAVVESSAKVEKYAKSGRRTNVLISVGLLSVIILIGYVALRKQS